MPTVRGTKLTKMDNSPRRKCLAVSTCIIDSEKGLNIEKSLLGISITAGSAVAMQEKNISQAKVEFMTNMQGKNALKMRAN